MSCAALVVLVLSIGASAAAAHTAQASVGIYPSGATFTATGAAPAGATSSVSLTMPIGAVDDAVILVRGASSVSIPSATIEGPLTLDVRFAHYVSVSGKLVPDALLPWDGSARATEETNQPLWLQVSVPDGTPAGTYPGTVAVDADGIVTPVAITVTVVGVTLPDPGQLQGSLLTAFNLNPQDYGNEVQRLFGISAQNTTQSLFSFFSSYRLSPNNWGYGNPKSKSGYTRSKKWWLDKTDNMLMAVGNPRRFGSMWIPVSNNRWPASSYVGGLSPYKPQTWCKYLKSVHNFWQSQGWLAGTFPYLYGLDEVGLQLLKVIRQSAQILHSCWSGGRLVITGNPAANNKALWDGGSDDVDVWAVLDSRYYGQYTNPSQVRKHISHAMQNLKNLNTVRKHKKQVWTYTYPSSANKTPGFGATEPSADPRLYVDWVALEGITGILYGEGTTTYQAKVNPLTSLAKDGAFVFIYPGKDGPIPSARLEEIREGIEDWEILNMVRLKHGSAAVRKLLAPLFTTSTTSTTLACTTGCMLKSGTTYSWPLFSHDATTPGKIATMRAQALAAAAS